MTIEQTSQGTETIVNPSDFYKEEPANSAPKDQAPETDVAPVETKTTIINGDEPETKEQVKEETKTDTKDATKDGEIKLAIPENYLLDKTRIDETAAFAKEHKLDSELANKILARENEAVAKVLKDSAEAFDKEARVEWVNTIKSDPEMGGEKFKETAYYSSQVLKQYGSETLIKELNESGYGNHPELVRCLAKIGRAMSPGKLVQGVGNPAPKVQPIEEKFYPNKEK